MLESDYLFDKTIHFKQLDGLRFLAVLSVLICHWITYPLIVNIPFGSMGVNLFFVLSGFLIGRLLLIDAESLNETKSQLLKKFYIRRSLRIFPIYYFVIVLLYLLNLKPVRESFLILIAYLFNIKFSLHGQWESGKYESIGHLWSLSVEEQFYLIFPFFVLYVNKTFRLKLIISMIIIGLMSRIILVCIDAPINSIYVFTTCCFDSFGIGALLAYLFIYRHDFLKQILKNQFIFILACICFLIYTVLAKNYFTNYAECRTIFERFLFSWICFL